MKANQQIALVVSATLLALAAPTSIASATVHRLRHAPIHVATPTDASPITPYVYPYGWRYRYNAQRPVYGALDAWEPLDSCRLWRYNYVYRVC
jgi:hypothetical protein